MGSYKVNKPNFNSNIYTFDNDDLVQGGQQGIDNKPLKELADNVAHIKKYKSQIITGLDNPNDINLYQTLVDDYQIQDIEIEQDTNNDWYIINLLYYKYNDGTFWKCILTNPLQSGETTPPITDGYLSWYNLTSQTILDTNEVRIARNSGSTGSTGDYFKLVQSVSSGDEYLTVEKYTNDVLDNELGNLKVNELNVNRIDAENSNVSNIANKEVLINANITQPSENSDGAFTIKRLKNVNMSISSIDENVTPPSGYTDLIGFDKVIGVPASGNVADVVNDNDFIQIKDTNENDGYYKVATVNVNDIYLYKSYKSVASDDNSGDGEIYLNDSAQILWNETDKIWELKTVDGQHLGLRVNSITETNSQSGSTSLQYSILYNRIIESQIEFNDFFNNIGSISVNEHVLIKANNDSGTNNYILNQNHTITNNLIKLTMQHNVKILLNNSVSGFTFNNVNDLEWDLFFSDGVNISNIITMNNCERISLNVDIENSNGTNIITSDNTSSFIELRLKYNSSEYDNIMNSCENFIISNCFIDNSSSGNDKIFNQCKNISIDGVINSETFIGTGDFDW